jgi:hypothetical protein
LVAFKNCRKIAIEFDTGNNLKFKGIEKLFQANADLCIGIVRGKCDTVVLNANVDRIEQVRRELGIFKKNIRLIVLAEKMAKKI